MHPVAPKRRPRVLAGRLLAKRLPARTRGRRWVHLILKDHQPTVCVAKFFSRRVSDD